MDRFYSSKPDQALRYIAVISKGKAPGEIDDEHGEGNYEFNKQKGGFAYEIKELYQLKRPIPLDELKTKYKTHNTEDCYDKLGNKSKRSATTAGNSQQKPQSSTLSGSK